jgi:hypothetical protein
MSLLMQRHRSLTTTSGTHRSSNAVAALPVPINQKRHTTMAYTATNSFAGKANAALTALHKAKDAVENRFGVFMYAVHEMLGDQDTMGAEVAPTAEWGLSAERRKDVANSVMIALGFDDEWNATNKAGSESAKAAAKAIKQAAARDVKRAIECIAAMDRLHSEVHAHNNVMGAYFNTETSEWRLPLAWFVKDSQEVMIPSKGKHKDGCTTFTDRNNKAFIVVQGDEGVETLAVSVTPDIVISLADIKPKVQKGADQKKADASNPDSLAAAADMLGVAASADDYKVTFTGDAADSFATLLAHIVRNDTLWSLALAERQQYQKDQNKAADNNTAAA